MICNKCGQENEKNAKYCEGCGKELIGVVENQSISDLENELSQSDSGSIAFASMLSIVAGVITIVGSFKMTQIKSISGDSIAENFYNSFGIFGMGFGVFMLAIGMYIYNKDN